MILIALGSNINGPWGSPDQTVRRAIAEMAAQDIHVLKLSRLLITPPFGVTDQPDFVNAALSADTEHTPESLMQVLHSIERAAGRQRELRWGPRTLDLDLLDYEGLIRNPEKAGEHLTLPHPGIAERSFVLQPILDIAPDWRHPLTRLSATEMLNALKSD
jgi:2-amino-4-hydroxy-6-hydroxymethyldihydropteridine diphosphokinase